MSKPPAGQSRGLFESCGCCRRLVDLRRAAKTNSGDISLSPTRPRRRAGLAFLRPSDHTRATLLLHNQSRQRSARRMRGAGPPRGRRPHASESELVKLNYGPAVPVGRRLRRLVRGPVACPFRALVSSSIHSHSRPRPWPGGPFEARDWTRRPALGPAGPSSGLNELLPRRAKWPHWAERVRLERDQSAVRASVSFGLLTWISGRLFRARRAFSRAKESKFNGLIKLSAAAAAMAAQVGGANRRRPSELSPSWPRALACFVS